MILTLSLDMPDFSYARKENNIYDFWLGRADVEKKEWNCVSRKAINQTSEERNTNKLSYALNNDGIYAVLFNPSDPVIEHKPICGFICEH